MVEPVFFVRVKETTLSEPRDDGRSSTVRGMYWATQISTLGMEVALPALGGFWLDRLWGTRPWLFLVGSLLGICVFWLSVLRLSRELGKKRPD
jgi:F0F1-type ATP synthase assembly protein I